MEQKNRRLAVAERMAKRGHEVAVLVLKPLRRRNGPPALSRIHLDMRKSPLSLLAGMLRARRFLRDFKPDLVHSHSFHANIFARLLKVAVLPHSASYPPFTTSTRAAVCACLATGSLID